MLLTETREMKIIILAAALALAACGRGAVTEEPPLNRDLVAANRAAIAGCEQVNWQGCGGGYLRSADNTTLRRILNADVDVVAGTETPRFDEISSTQILEAAVPGEEGDRYLNGVQLILPSDQALWEAASIEYARQRVDQPAAP